jgi:beta-lactam-binding protein with PASTA domain
VVNRLGLLIKILLLASGMILTAVLSTWVVFAFLTRGGEVSVPDLSRVELKAALERASQANLGLRVSGTGYDPGVPPGHVISQDPGPGIRTKKNRIIHVVVSQGTRTVFVPDLTGRNLRNAELILIQAGLNLGRVARTHDLDTHDGDVISQFPAPDLFVERSTAVNLLISQGPRPSTYLLPDLTGMPVEEVLTSIRKWGLESGRVVEEESPDLPPGTVTALNPAPGSPVTEGQSIQLTVSKMPARPEPSPVVLFQYSSPPGLLDRDLTLVLDTGSGPRTILEKTISPGSSVSLPVTVSAQGTLKIFLDGVLVEEREVP